MYLKWRDETTDQLFNVILNLKNEEEIYNFFEDIATVSEIKAFAQSLQPKLVELRRDLHEHPELAWQEIRTTRVIAESIEPLGFDIVKRGINGTESGLIAELAGVNAPALNYYFMNNEGVYSACTEYMVERIWDYLAPTIEAAQALLGTRPDTEQLIDTFCAIQS